MHRLSDARHGFTLIELLVVMVVVALLISLSMPMLLKARATARDVNCKANLRTLQQGWAVYMNASGSAIPYTRTTSQHPNWWDGMDSVFPDAPDVWDDSAGTFNTCPTVQRNYPEMFYFTTRWGYAINVWWSNEGDTEEQLNEWKSWDAIRQPSRYAWFMDPEVVPFGSGHLGAPYAPNTLSSFGSPNWGVGAHHQGGTGANVSFADGGVRGVPIQEIQADSSGPDQFTWFANR